MTAAQGPARRSIDGSVATRPVLAPRMLIAAVMVLIGITLLVVFLGASGRRPGGLAHHTRATERLLRFGDRDDGAVIVTDATSGAVLGLVTGQNGFLRVSLTGLVRIRHLYGIDAGPPFKLTSYDDGRLTLGDPSTGKVIELEAFGPTNQAVFGWFMTAGAAVASLQPGDGQAH